MRKSLYFLFVISALSFAACTDPSAVSVDDMSFPLERLTGSWEDVNRQNKFYEEWTMIDDGHLKGKGYVLSGADTVFIEQLEIKTEGKDLFYIVRLSGSHNEEAVRFKMEKVGEDEIVFENPAHDFPKSITYRMISNIEMSVFLNGKENGRFGEERFSFVRK